MYMEVTNSWYKHMVWTQNQVRITGLPFMSGWTELWYQDESGGSSPKNSNEGDCAQLYTPAGFAALLAHYLLDLQHSYFRVGTQNFHKSRSKKKSVFRSTLPSGAGEYSREMHRNGTSEHQIRKTHRRCRLRECQVPGRILVRLALLDGFELQPHKAVVKILMTKCLEIFKALQRAAPVRHSRRIRGKVPSI